MKQAVLESSYLSEFCMELYLIVRAGIPFQEGIALLSAEESDKTKKDVLQKLNDSLEQGENLSEAFRQTGSFPHYAVEMIAIGQNTGYLEKVFYALANYYDRMTQFKQSIRNIVWYPMILLTMMAFVIVVLLVKVMPIFADIFARLGAELSPVAQFMLQIGQGLSRYGVVLLFILLFVIAILFVVGKSEWVSKLLQERFYDVTSDWRVRKVLISSNLADALVLALSSGMSIDAALDMTGRLIQDTKAQEQIAACRKAMLVDDKSFADACMECKLFAPVYCRMIAVGFRTGNMDDIMSEVARRIANDADDALDALVNRIEPTLVIILSLMVGIILLSVMVPLLSIMTAIG